LGHWWFRLSFEKKGSGSFLKKRTKKLLRLAVRAVMAASGHGQRASRKSFLFLFFKKEDLAFLPKATRVSKISSTAQQC
jgi:hypothetical protein